MIITGMINGINFKRFTKESVISESVSHVSYIVIHGSLLIMIVSV